MRTDMLTTADTDHVVTELNDIYANFLRVGSGLQMAIAAASRFDEDDDARHFATLMIDQLMLLNDALDRACDKLDHLRMSSSPPRRFPVPSREQAS